MLDGSQVTVPMMRQSTNLGYGEGEGVQVVELPYDGQELSMVILVPQAGQFESFEDALNAAQVASLLRSTGMMLGKASKPAKKKPATEAKPRKRARPRKVTERKRKAKAARKAGRGKGGPKKAAGK